MIPPFVEQFPSSAEEKIFKKLEQETGLPGYCCFHSLGIARHAYKHEGEADFILAGPRGLFAIEVKGGHVERKDGLWLFRNRYGHVNEKKESPFRQAQSAIYSIREDLFKKFGKRIDAYDFGYGVAFTDMEFTLASPEWDNAIVMDSRDMDRPMTPYLERMMSFWESRPGNRTSMGEHDLREIVTYLRGDFDVVRRVSMHLKLAEDELLRLTEGQYSALDNLSTNKRIVFIGAAGTGKTLIAFEKARRNAAQGIRTLFICFNKLLAAYLRAVAKVEGINGMIVVDSIHHFFREAIFKAGLQNELERASRDMDQSEIYRNLYPEFFLRAWGASPKFNELIIDEGQDILLPEYIMALDQVIDGGFENGKWALFLDPEHQKGIYGAYDQNTFDEIAESAARYTLGVNCRNTRPIAVHTEVISGYPMAEVRQVEGIPVTYIWFDDLPHQAEQVSEAVNRLLADGVKPDDITILSPKRWQASLAGSGHLHIKAPILEIREDNVQDDRHGRIGCATIQAFKGLESPVIFITDIDEIETDWMKSVNYVGFTRARSGLWVSMHSGTRKAHKRLISDVAMKTPKP